MRLYFVRHGESQANLRREFSNTGSKHPLTEKGVAQARTLAAAFSAIPVARIYSSPILRATQTTHLLAEEVHAPVELNEALREWSVGIYEGTTDALGWELHSQVQEDWFIRQKFDSRMPGGESFNDIRERFLPFIEEIAQSSEAEDRNVVLVGHGGLFAAMLPVILTNVDFAFARSHGFSYTDYALAESRPDGLWCRVWCGVAL